MVSQEVFISNCVYDLCTKNHSNYEDIINDIRLFVDTNLSNDLKSPLYMQKLCGKILYEYLEFNNYFIEEGEEEDDILYRAVDIWLAAADAEQLSIC
jgi:hypothetical protein